jgi:hypothetical protein
MKLRGLVIVGLLLLTFGSISGWWILGQNNNVVSISGFTWFKDTTTDPITSQPKLWLAWYGDDTVVYRLQVNAVVYEELYSSLRQSLAQDQVRMESIAGSHLATELSPIFTELTPRLNRFLSELFEITSSAAFLSQGLSIASEILKTQNSQSNLTTTEISDLVRAKLASEMVIKFRDTVLLPGFTMRALRSASGRAFSMVRQDLLENCDRYDRAFRDFILKTSGTVESRDGESGWRPDPSWQQGNATFFSFCPDLRRQNLTQLSDTPLIESFSVVEETVQAQALELLRPLTDVSMNVAIHSGYISDTLHVILPASISNTLAFGISALSSSWTLAKQVLDKLGGTLGKERLEIGLKATLDGLQTDSIQRLHSVYRAFIAVEMERIGINLAARSEGEWSKQ